MPRITAQCPPRFRVVHQTRFARSPEPDLRWGWYNPHDRQPRPTQSPVGDRSGYRADTSKLPSHQRTFKGSFHTQGSPREPKASWTRGKMPGLAREESLVCFTRPKPGRHDSPVMSEPRQPSMRGRTSLTSWHQKEHIHHSHPKCGNY